MGMNRSGMTAVGRGQARLLVAGGVAVVLLLTGCGVEETRAEDATVSTPEASAEPTEGVPPSVEASALSAGAGTTGATDEATDAATDAAGTPSSATAPEQAAPEQAVPVEKKDGEAASAAGLDTAPTGSTGPVEAVQEGELVLFTKVRVASQNGFDRVVFEYEGDGVPSYSFSYRDEATQQATGDLIDLPGSTGLSGFIHGIAWIEPGNYEGPKRLTADGTQAVTVVDVGVLFEGDQDPYIGVEGERPYRVTVLRDPTRIVVDVAH